MNRIKWFRLTVKTELSTFARHLASKVFVLEDPVSAGFRIEKKSKDEIVGQFIYKKTFDQTVVLPSGQEFSQEVATIEVTRFAVCAMSSGLLLQTFDAPRSSTFLNALSEATKFTCTVEPIEVDVKQWVEQLDLIFNSVSAHYLDVTGIRISDSVQGRLALSGAGDVYSELREFLGSNTTGVVESAKIRLGFDGAHYMVELGRRAAIKAPAGLSFAAIDNIRKAMLCSISAEGK